MVLELGLMIMISFKKNTFRLVEVKLIKKERAHPFNLKIQDSTIAGKFFQFMIGENDRETFSVIGLDAKGFITYYEKAHIGILSQSIIHPREIFKSAIVSNSHSIIIAHNHPSGDVTPSGSDCDITKDIETAGKILKIEVLDHLIISDDKYYSIRENKTHYNEEKKNE